MAMNAFRFVLVFFAIACIGNLPAEAAYNENAICLDSIDESARITRSQLQRLQEIPIGTRLEVEAYCSLPSRQLATQEGVVEVRRTFLPFEWDPENGLILLWRGDVYMGYDFRLVR
jgi:hypothetical protein